MSGRLEPIRFSVVVMVSTPWPTAVPAARFAFTGRRIGVKSSVSVPASPRYRSLPKLLRMRSLPLPPQIKSLPPRPLMTSLPPRAWMTSLPGVPLMTSLASVPTIVARLAPQTKKIGTGRVGTMGAATAAPLAVKSRPAVATTVPAM